MLPVSPRSPPWTHRPPVIGVAGADVCVSAPAPRLASLTALFTSPRQQAPEGLLTSHAQFPAFSSAVMRAGMVDEPVRATSCRKSARV